MHLSSATRAFCLPALILVASALQAAPIISNYPQSGSALSGALLGTVTRSFSLGFTMPGGDSYALNSVTMSLNVNAVGGSFFLELFSGSPDPFDGPLTTFTVPTFNTLGAADYTFTPDSLITLLPSTTYWLVAYNTVTGSTNQIAMLASSPGITPTGYATFAGQRFNTGPATVPATGPFAGSTPTFEVDATALGDVPEPSTYSLIAGGLGLLAWSRRRAKSS